MACPDCGTRRDEQGSWRFDAQLRQDVFVPAKPLPFEVHTLTCFVCKAREEKIRSYEGGVPPGVKVGSRRRRRR